MATIGQRQQNADSDSNDDIFDIYQNVISIELNQLSWYHGDMSRHVAEGLLLHSGIKDGTYLLRDSHRSSQERGRRTYAVSVRFKNSIKHFELRDLGEDVYEFGMFKFSGTDEVVEHFRTNPLIGDGTGQMVTLRYPYPRDVEEDDLYDTVNFHTQMMSSATQPGQIMELNGGSSAGQNQHDLTNNTDVQQFSIQSKEGFLTKCGGSIKTWRRRWFVLVRSDLKYYRDRMDPNPVRVIDLTQCLDCSLLDMPKRQYTFRLVSPSRTFYMSATTSEQCEEWIRAISKRIKPS